MDHVPGKFVWFEHFSSDVSKARRFYEPLFGWHVEAMPVGAQRYHLAMNGSDGIGGFRTAGPGVPAHWFSYLSVADVDREHAAALAAGARELLAPADMGAVGRCSGLRDPTGAAFALWKGSQGDRPDVERTPVGDWIWNELLARDEQAALAFYERVFGYSHDTMDFGGQGVYRILKSGDKARGGLMQTSDPGVEPMWLPYVHVADCDACVAKAIALGGHAPQPGMDVPGVGRFAMLRDPQGAAIAVLAPVM